MIIHVMYMSFICKSSYSNFLFIFMITNEKYGVIFGDEKCPKQKKENLIENKTLLEFEYFFYMSLYV